MAKHSFVFTLIWAVAIAAAAQDTPQTVTVTGRAPATAAVAGFDDTPLSRAPFSATTIGPSALSDAGIANLADIARVSPGLTDAYNAVGYWSNFTVRGYALDQRNNYRRDGLPINAETSLWLGNKQSIDVLRGTSGMQAGVSAPGGLVDLVVKRPNGAHRSAVLSVESDGTYGLALDLGDRAGPDGRIGWRLSAEATHLDPPLNAARGKRQGIAAAGDWRIDADKLLEAEIELNHQSQPSQPGFSMLGNRVPDARDIDPRINLNNQPWSLPVVFTGETASLRWTQRLGGDLSFRRPRDDAMAAHRRPHRVSVRLLGGRQLRPLLQRRQLRLLRLSQRGRAPAQRRARPEHRQSRLVVLSRAPLARRRARRTSARRHTARRVQLRRHRHHRRPDRGATGCDRCRRRREARRTQPRGLRARPMAAHAGRNAVAGAAIHPSDSAQHRH